MDATPLTAPTGGVRRYTEELRRALVHCFPEDEYLLVSDQAFDAAAPSPRGESQRGILARRWWSYGIQREMKRLRADAFHGTDFSVPYLPLQPAVMTLHDLSPWRKRDAPAASARIRRRAPILLRLGLATMVITPSETVRQEAMAAFRLAADRVVATPLAAAPLFRPVAPPPRARPYFLFAATIEPRKNLDILIPAWRNLKLRADLVLIGRRREDGPFIQPEPGLEWLGIVSDDDLASWYSGAVAVVYPSSYEGFGLPVLEAMQCGAPVISSRAPAIRETAGGAALEVEAGDVRDLSEAMCAALEPGFAQRWRERSLARAAEFGWEKTARATREVYVEAIRRFRG